MNHFVRISGNDKNRRAFMQKTAEAALIFVFLLFCRSISAQQWVCKPEDKAVFDQYIAYITPYKTRPDAEVLEKTAAFFIGTPYVAHTLDLSETEQLTVNLRELDCFTYVENVIALSQTAVSENPTFECFIENLQNIRYRGGIVEDFSSRLHYASDWAFENEKRGLLTDISKKLGGLRETKPINFMSAHRSSYMQLKTDDAMLAKIKELEKRINDRGGFYYLPKEKIAVAAGKIPKMAVVGFATDIEGLDITHLGFVWRKNGRVGFIHASSKAMKVTIDTESISSYCLSRKSCTGVMLTTVRLK
ncbi:MAG: DUF1460 domain-containing protein [Dysgonamonadaceae bacterium]|jgi:hypothetical protein|nr:DUF1460 domain-containing protein [Dysgonamonadaceae bacterium]